MMSAKRHFYLTLLAATGLSTTMAHAQPAAVPAEADASSTALPDIVVTAQKRSEKLSNVPLSVTAVTGENLAKLGITSAADLEKVVPGFFFNPSQAAMPVYSIRGLGTFDEAVLISPAVSVYLDQVPLPFPRMTEGVALDVQRVEVLKGPQGTLFGQNSTGGAVNYIPNGPTDQLSAGAKLTYGRFNEIDVEGFISGPLTDNVGARIAVRTEQRDRWQISPTHGGKRGSRNFTTGRAILEAHPGDNLKLQLGLNGWVNRSETPGMQFMAFDPTQARVPGRAYGPDLVPALRTLLAAMAVTPPAPNKARVADWNPENNYERNDKFGQIYLRGELALSDQVTVNSITSYSYLKVKTPLDLDGTALPNTYNLVTGHVKSFNQELRLSGSLLENDQLKWMVGANYEHDSSQDRQNNTFLSTSTANVFPVSLGAAGPVFQLFTFRNLDNYDAQKIESKAAFASLDFAPIDAVTLYASIRYTDRNNSFNGCMLDHGGGDLAGFFAGLSNLLTNAWRPGPPAPIGPVPAGTCVTLDGTTNLPVGPGGVTKHLNENNTSWRVGGSWKPTPDVMLYANVTKGYKAGNFSNVPMLFSNQSEPATQEAVLAYETGFKATLLDRRAQLTGAVFYYDYDHKQLLGQTPTPLAVLPALKSIPRARVKGAEIDLTVQPVTGLTLRAGGSYIDSRVLGTYFLVPAAPPTGLNPAGTVASGDIGGQRFPNTPKWQASASAQYEHPISAGWSAFAGAGLSYRGKTFSIYAVENPELYVLGDRAILDLRAGFEQENGQIRVEFWGRNVTNKFYTTNVGSGGDAITRSVGMPATYGVTLTTRY